MLPELETVAIPDRTSCMMMTIRSADISVPYFSRERSFAIALSSADDFRLVILIINPALSGKIYVVPHKSLSVHGLSHLLIRILLVFIFYFGGCCSTAYINAPTLRTYSCLDRNRSL